MTVIDKVLPHMTQIAQVSPKWGIIMISGGHFAAGLFEGIVMDKFYENLQFTS